MAGFPRLVKMSRTPGVMLAFFTLLFIAAAITGLSLFSRPDQPQDLLNIMGLPDGAQVEAQFLANKKITDLVFEKNHANLPAQQAKVTPPYQLTASIKMPWGDYRDFNFTVNETPPNLTVLASGFSADDRISLSFDKNKIYQNIPMDWSGRLELSASLPPKLTGVACVKITGWLQSLDVCHKIPERRPA